MVARGRGGGGDSLSSEVVAALMAGEAAQMVFTDPPYNVPIAL